MNAVLARAALSLPGIWARIYTLGLPVAQRAERILKIDSDVFEQRASLEGGPGARTALEAFVCTVQSLWADVTWRLGLDRSNRVAAAREGRLPFPALSSAFLAIAGITAFARLSAVHGLPGNEHIALLIALIVGPVLGVLGILVARLNLVTGVVALLFAATALAASTWATIVAPIGAALGLAAGLYSIFETRSAMPGAAPGPGRSAAPANHPPAPSELEEIMHTPDRLERWLSLGALLFVASIGCWAWFQSAYPHADKSDATIVADYAGASEASAYAAFLAGALGGLGIIAFFGSLYPAVRRAEGQTGYIASLMLSGAVLAAVFWMATNAVITSNAVAYAYEDEFRAAGLDAQLVRLLDVLGFALSTMAWAGLALATGALAVVSLRQRAVLARWLAWPAAVLAVLLLLSFPLFGMPVFLFALWALAATAWRLFARPSTAPATGTAGANPAPA